MNFMSVLHYAVEYLKIKDIVIVGHYDCGGLKAALSNRDHRAPVELWLSSVRDEVKQHLPELRLLNDEDKLKRLVEIHLLEQLKNILKTPIVQNARSASMKACGTPFPRVHGMIHNPFTGKIRRVRFNIERLIDESFNEVYSLGTPLAPATASGKLRGLNEPAELSLGEEEAPQAVDPAQPKL